MPKLLQTSGKKRFLSGYFDDPRIADANSLSAPSVNVDITKTGEAIYGKGFTPVTFDLNNAGHGPRPFHVPGYNVTFFAINGKVLFVNHNNSDAVVDTGVSLSDTNGRNTRFIEYAGEIFFTNQTDGLHQIHMGQVNGAASSGASIITLDQDFIGRLSAFSGSESTINGTLRIANTSPFTEAYSIYKAGAVSGAATNGSGLIRITTTNAHGLKTGVSVVIASVGGTTEANGTWVVTVIDATNFDLVGSAFVHNWTSGGTATWLLNGILPLTTTLDANVADNTIVYVVKDISSGRPKSSGISLWKERMILWASAYDADTDSTSNVIYLSAFASDTALENIIDFNVATTAAHEMVGKGGAITNVLSTRDYLYAFTQNETYYTAVADINLTSGASPFQLLSNLYGCINDDCSADLGNGLAAFMTNNKRIIGIRIATQTGAPVVFPDATFDSPISNTNALLDTDQSTSFFFHSPSDHKLYVHCDVDTTRIVQKFNTEIQKWEPPRNGISWGGMYEYNGVTYGCELTDDNVYQFNDGFQYDGENYEVVIAGNLIESDDGRTNLSLERVGISGRISDLTTVTLENVVGEGSTPQQKSFTAPVSASSGSIGSVSLGSTTLGDGMGTDMSPYDEIFGIYPRYGQNYQWRARSTTAVSGGAFSVSSYSVYGSVLANPLLTLK